MAGGRQDSCGHQDGQESHEDMEAQAKVKTSQVSGVAEYTHMSSTWYTANTQQSVLYMWVERSILTVSRALAIILRYL